MRTDLSASFIAAKNASFRRPRQLLVFHFPEAGNVYVSDQKLGAADGLANEYQPLVESWGELHDSAGDATSDDNGEIRQVSITLWNGGEHPFSDYFLAEYPENVEVELYQWFAGLPESSKALIDRFVIQDPIEFDEASRLLSLDLVGLPIKYDQPCGDLLTRENWPYAADDDIGRGIPVAFGIPGAMPALVGKTAQSLTLKGSILAGTMTLNVYEDLDELIFPTSGNVMIDEEQIRFYGRTSSSLIVHQRGYLSTAAEHLDKREIISVINDHTYLLCAGPVEAITNVKIDGYPAPTDIYTVRPDLDPARIIFSEKPWVTKYGEATRFLEMQFDATSAGNTAYQAYYAYDSADDATAAKISPSYPKLALKQTTVNSNRGEILKAYLAIEHWTAGTILADFAEVYVSGVGVVGNLSRPNADDTVSIDAEVDIDHGHSHEIGGEHIHNFTQPAVATSDPTHPHSGSISGGEVSDGGDVALPFYITNYDTSSFPSYKTKTFDYQPQGTIISKTLHFRCLKADYDYVEINTGYTTMRWEYAVTSIDQLINILPSKTSVTVKIGHTTVVGAQCTILEMTLTTVRAGSIDQASTGVTASATGGAVKNTGVVNVKNEDDVADLTTDNVSVEVTDQDNPSHSAVNLFDLTDYVKFDWNWFTNREITVTYVNNGDDKEVYILHAFFDIEYVPTEVVYSDDITAEVTSLSDCIRPDLAIKKLLAKSGVADTDFDAASFAAIGAKFDSLGYRLDGLIDAEETVWNAVKRICYQTHSRCFTSAGKLKMALREGHPASKPISRQLTPDNLQLRSIKASRQPLREIANRVQLFYDRDWTASDSATSGYLASVTREDADSISRFGLKTQTDSYTFDLIRDAAMAAKVADFYLMVDAWPSTFYTLTAYLDQFDLEKEDVIGVSANWNQMNKVPMVLRAMNRQFGSGKNGAINLVRIVAENLFYLLSKVSRDDAVLIMDTLSMMILETGDYAEAVHAIDQLLLRLNVSRADVAVISDTLLTVWSIRGELAEAVAVSAAVYAELTLKQQDAVLLDDYPEFWSTYGFGSGGFGQTPFGGLMSAWRQKSPDEFFVFERLLAALNAYRSSTVTVSDALLLSSGFGGKLSSGFGLSPFGG